MAADHPRLKRVAAVAAQERGHLEPGCDHLAPCSSCRSALAHPGQAGRREPHAQRPARPRSVRPSPVGWQPISWGNGTSGHGAPCRTRRIAHPTPPDRALTESSGIALSHGWFDQFVRGLSVPPLPAPPPYRGGGFRRKRAQSVSAVVSVAAVRGSGHFRRASAVVSVGLKKCFRRRFRRFDHHSAPPSSTIE